MRGSALVEVPAPDANMRRAFCVLTTKPRAGHTELSYTRN